MHTPKFETVQSLYQRKRCIELPRHSRGVGLRSAMAQQGGKVALWRNKKEQEQHENLAGALLLPCSACCLLS